MAPIRILQVVTIMNRGGLETMLMNYYRQMDRTKIQFDFIVHRNQEGHYDKEIMKLGGKIYRMAQIKPGNYRFYFKQLEEFFCLHPEYKVVHSHINENSSFVLNAAKKAGIPCRIAHSHLSDLGIDFKLPFRLYARYRMKDNPTHYFACSQNAGKWLFGKQNKNVKILPNAVNTEEFKYSERMRTKIKEELGIKDGLIIGHIGRFNKQKNHDFLIKIFKEVQQKSPKAVLLMIGDGDLRKAIEKKAANLGLTANVKFLGVRGDISDVMQAMDVFLFPSRFEGLPVVLVEAQAAGLKCIVSDAVTKECDVTGSVTFISLRQSPKYWADQILHSALERTDTAAVLNKEGYDSAVMAHWLAGFYSNYYATWQNKAEYREVY